ncbi:galactose-1-phosphate uridylyltransferase [Marinitoga sp. 1135]|uniref:Galactose-1-phosphate uridylyltransferase n=1 Tax=Marinitoga piezophila (strain DSM 14283 / JCM 11233 / KA3) TaxID=443254 RepID=H2J458_MARPK|nr:MULTISPECIES: galactose-1-phosphate uridylyltransferase [Marinitoga]AEX85873.1 galactose-1-phosphate uridylyltransferase, family 1 [Marinitoga piezophila KA3]APT76309.1 galactose-1-phosphate uridylyltransferase [Marinitoga sp. 1137]NUU96075.1 galactose-1-phosphate uridylyltransferase [Marinitoga sp. 1135]NUU97986.1 galactose-1-phosphate uridylyltransferase [Marinitoga sp. 1138]
MPEYRKDPITNRWVIISSERSNRPIQKIERKEISEEIFCPFDKGNEHLTPPEILAFKPENSKPNDENWWIRVVPNKFPAVIPDISPKFKKNGIYYSLDGYGYHEVIIESQKHHHKIYNMSEKEVEEIIWAYLIRFNEIKKDKKIKYIQIFKNYGSDAGASLEHPHSQLIATPIIPIYIEEELKGAKNFYSLKKKCIFCSIIEQEKIDNIRIIEENEHFIAFEPFAPRFPYETWIIPKEHSSDFGILRKFPEKVKSFAEILQHTVYNLYSLLGDIPYNYMIHTSPFDNLNNNFYHWHLELIPRLTHAAGFEWGSGFFINSISPEVAAKNLKKQRR